MRMRLFFFLSMLTVCFALVATPFDDLNRLVDEAVKSKNPLCKQLKDLKFDQHMEFQLLSAYYRKLARCFHPDKNPGNEEWANKNMRELNAAYEQAKGPRSPATAGSSTALGDLLVAARSAANSPKTAIFLRDLNIDTFPADFFNRLAKEFPGLKFLSFHDCNITKIPAEIGVLHNLIDLNFSDNQIKQIPAEIGDLRNLLHLDFSYNQIGEVPANIGNLQDLYEVNLEGNLIQRLPVEIGNLKKLKNFNLSGNKFSEIPVEIGRLQNLEELYFTENKIEKVSDVIGSLRKLSVLGLSLNKIAEVSGAIGNLQNLFELNLGSNKIQRLPAEIGRLGFLRNLKLAANKLTEIPAEIGKLQELERLVLEDNKIQALPSELAMLPKLKFLNIRENPSAISQSPVIQELKRRGVAVMVDDTRLGDLLHQLDPEIMQNRVLIGSESFSLQPNYKIDRFPADFFTHLATILPDLQYLLIVQYESLQDITGIGQLTSLKELRLGDNGIKKLPAEIGNLKNLKKLHLSGNKIRILPPELGRLSKLTELYLSNNELTDDSLFFIADQMKSLTRLSIAHNRIDLNTPAAKNAIAELRARRVNVIV